MTEKKEATLEDVVQAYQAIIQTQGETIERLVRALQEFSRPYEKGTNNPCSPTSSADTSP